MSTDVEAEPDETADAAETDLSGSEPGGVAGSDASHFGEVVHRSEFDVVGVRELPHEVELAGNAFAPGNAGLGAAIENFFDGVESGVVDALPESEVEGVGRGRIVEGQHLEGFEDRKRNAARRLDGGGIEGSCDGTSPLQRERRGDFLFGGKAEFLDPFPDLSVRKQRRGPADVRGRAPDLAGLEKWWT